MVTNLHILSSSFYMIILKIIEPIESVRLSRPLW